MTEQKSGARVRAEAATAVDAVIVNGRSLDVALARAEQRVGASQQALLRMLCYGTLRYHWRLCSHIDALLQRPLKARDSVINSLIAVGLFQLTDTRIPDHAAVTMTVEAARLLRRPKYAGLINAVLRNFLRKNLADEEPADDITRYNHPRWLIEMLQKDWPQDWQEILRANNEQAPMWLRVNSRHGSVSDYIEELDHHHANDERPAARSQAGLDDAVLLERPMAVDDLPGFRDGRVSVQDAAAQLAAPWLLLGGGRRILDACAAPGGKTGHLLELAGPAAALTAIDRDESRIGGIAGNLARLGLDADVHVADAAKPADWWDGKAFDRILLDAPCSATGVIRRHPDIKILRREDDIAALASRQEQLLEALWALLAPGGRLIYATCSVLSEENDAVVGRFLSRFAAAKELQVLPNNNIRDLMVRKATGYQLLPGRYGMDGFYYACLERKRAPEITR